MDLSGHQCGILELACGTVVAPFERVFGMKMVYCEDEEQKHKQEGNVELFSVYLSHRILCVSNIRKREEKSQPAIRLPWIVFLSGLKLDFESAIHQQTWRTITFDQFVLLIQDIVHAEVKLNPRENIPG